MLRLLRYTPAAFFALLALAFVGLWVRSWHWQDTVHFWVTRDRSVSLRSSVGLAQVVTICPDDPPISLWKLATGSEPVDATIHRVSVFRYDRFGFRFSHASVNGVSGAFMWLPHWFLALISLALAALLAFKPITRFTVRGLLITTTLLAAVLGLAVYAV